MSIKPHDQPQLKTDPPFREYVLDRVFPRLIPGLLPLDPSFPVRRVVPTYLKKLDRFLRGGLSWQYPLVLAGPKDAGKTQLVYQFLASALLSYDPPWRCLVFDCRDRFRYDRVQQILIRRTGRRKSQQHGGRIEKVTIRNKKTFYWTLLLALQRMDVALLVVDGFDQLLAEIPFVDGLAVLLELMHLRQMGLIVTLRGSVQELLPSFPWDTVPFLFYLTKLRHRCHRLRVWLNGANCKEYDHVLTLAGLFKEGSPKRGSQG